ncbi:glycosyltransferase family 2 protein [Vibrio rumoiensis]|uniref:glycosyltransferase family 2 protein n=1 Tax=Vibrio rumoiensis TaxID=76258 RepID=UPI003AA841C1
MQHYDDLVSVIMPAFNVEETIISSLKSVMGQTYKNIQLIIIDDESVDDTKKIVKDFIKHNSPEITVDIIDNTCGKGARGARQSGINYAHGRYIAFLDSDDLWLPEKIEHQLDFMKHNNYAFTFSDYFMKKNDTKKEFYARKVVDFIALTKTCDIGCLTVMLDKKLIGEIKIPNMPKEDYALWLSLLKNENIKAYNIQEILAIYNVQDSSLSSNKFKEIFKQFTVLRNVAKLGFFESIYKVIHYVFNGLTKHKL